MERQLTNFLVLGTAKAGTSSLDPDIYLRPIPELNFLAHDCRGRPSRMRRRVENIRRVAEIARLLGGIGLIVVVSLISPFIREIAADIDFLEVFVDAPLAVCEAREPKRLYEKDRAGAIVNFTGIDAPYEAPPSPDLSLQTASASLASVAEMVIAQLRQRSIL